MEPMPISDRYLLELKDRAVSSSAEMTTGR
jgi:hypothetical protein